MNICCNTSQVMYLQIGNQCISLDFSRFFICIDLHSWLFSFRILYHQRHIIRKEDSSQQNQSFFALRIVGYIKNHKNYANLILSMQKDHKKCTQYTSLEKNNEQAGFLLNTPCNKIVLIYSKLAFELSKNTIGT